MRCACTGRRATPLDANPMTNAGIAMRASQLAAAHYIVGPYQSASTPILFCIVYGAQSDRLNQNLLTVEHGKQRVTRVTVARLMT